MTVAEKVKSTVQPFGVQADHPHNSDILLQSIPGCKLRTRIVSNKPITDRKTGQPMVPTDQASFLSMLPTIPGMEIHVNPAKLSYVISDPLHDDDDLCERIAGAINHQRGVKIDKVRGVEPQHGTLDQHRMKTLCRELLRWRDQQAVKLVKGSWPTDEDVEALPGHFLLNPGSFTFTGQPRFEKDWDRWVEKLSSGGG